ncbi:hypothetical protein MVEN_01467200 [Mycena venus]|uniref:Isochorismatase-like domain-containing protein n=1 Tax=Mycena venus TaxID=2733690 RepID=A0A8H6XUT2_9AGAR|nr:hypothetical protein MVEN_01467200 [Mycena venus]
MLGLGLSNARTARFSTRPSTTRKLLITPYTKIIVMLDPTPTSFRTHLHIPPSTVSPTDRDSILIIIDAQNEYAYGKMKVKKLEETRGNILALLERYRSAHAPVAHVVHITPPGTSVFTPDTPLADIFPELQPDASRIGTETDSKGKDEKDFEVIVPKRFPGAFAETILQEVVERAGVRKLVLVGYMAHVCVSTTAREAHQRGYDVVVVSDAVGDRDLPGLSTIADSEEGGLGARGEDVTRMVMIELADAFATVLKTDDVQ